VRRCNVNMNATKNIHMQVICCTTILLSGPQMASGRLTATPQK
jgi:hypothetical protein